MADLTRELVRQELKSFAEDTLANQLDSLRAKFREDLGLVQNGKASHHPAASPRQTSTSYSASPAWEFTRLSVKRVNKVKTSPFLRKSRTFDFLADINTPNSERTSTSPRSVPANDLGPKDFVRSDSHEWIKRPVRGFQAGRRMLDDTEGEASWDAANSSPPEITRTAVIRVKPHHEVKDSPHSSEANDEGNNQEAVSDSGHGRANSLDSTLATPASVVAWTDLKTVDDQITPVSDSEPSSPQCRSRRGVSIHPLRTKPFGFRKAMSRSFTRSLPRGLSSLSVALTRRQVFERFIRSERFEYCIGFLILLNAVSISVQTEYSAKNGGKNPPLAFRIVESCFAVIFAAEITLKISVNGFRRFFTGRGWEWNIVDTIIVFMLLLEEALSAIVYGYASQDFVELNFSIVRILRLLRLGRILRLLRILKLVGELRTLITSISKSLKSLLWTLVLLALIMYFFAIYFTQAVADYPGDSPGHKYLRQYFGTLGRSFLSLFQCVTGGIDWDNLADPMIDVISPVLAILLCVYIAFTVIAMLNVVTGVFVDSALKCAADENTVFIINKIREVFKEANEGDDNGRLTIEDFLNHLNGPVMRDYFKAIDLDPSEASGLFQLLDVNGHGSIDAETFIAGCLRVHGKAKALDLALLMQEVHRISVHSTAHAQHIEGQLQKIQDMLVTPPTKIVSAKQTQSTADSPRALELAEANGLRQVAQAPLDTPPVLNFAAQPTIISVTTTA